MNKTQNIIADLMKQSNFNEFNGEEVVDTLIKHQDLWRGFVWGRFDYSPLITVRDIDGDTYNADTLYILCDKENAETLLLTLTEETNADEIDVEDEMATNKLLGSYPSDMSLIRLWWD